MRINSNLTPKDVYSTDEVKTNKVWIDGKPIYKKTFTGNCAENTALAVGKIDLDTITNSYGWAISIYDGNSWGIPSGRTDDYLTSWRYSTQNSTLYIIFEKNYNSTNKYVFTIEYTKN